MNLQVAIDKIPVGSTFDILTFLHYEHILLESCGSASNNCPLSIYLTFLTGYQVKVDDSHIRLFDSYGDEVVEAVNTPNHLVNFVYTWDDSTDSVYVDGHAFVNRPHPKNLFNPKV